MNEAVPDVPEAQSGAAIAIRAAIRHEGPLRFDRFQELALYGEGGYYERPGRVGRLGDFVTGASWHPAFARCLLRVARGVAVDCASPVDILDVGCGEGELLQALDDSRGEPVDGAEDQKGSV